MCHTTPLHYSISLAVLCHTTPLHYSISLAVLCHTTPLHYSISLAVLCHTTPLHYSISLAVLCHTTRYSISLAVLCHTTPLHYFISLAVLCHTTPLHYSIGDGRDYVSFTISLILDGSTSRACVDVETVDEEVYESTEIFAVTLTTEDSAVEFIPEISIMILDSDEGDSYSTHSMISCNDYSYHSEILTLLTY